MDYGKFSSSHRHFLASVTIETEPTRYSEVVSHSKWCTAMQQEIEALEKNGNWSLTSMPLEKLSLVSK